MSSAVADPLPRPSIPPMLTIVVADTPRPGLLGPQIARLLRHWHGTVTVRDVDDVAIDRPHAVIVAVHADMPAGLAALRRIRKETPATRILVVAPDNGATAARQALNAGAEAFVPADAAAQVLAPALEAVMADLVCVPRASRRAVAKPTFSHREKEVLGLLVAGLTNRQIAAQLFLAESTVKSHLAAAFAKLGVRSRKDAVSVLLDPEEGLATTALPHAPPTPG